MGQVAARRTEATTDVPRKGHPEEPPAAGLATHHGLGAGGSRLCTPTYATDQRYGEHVFVGKFELHCQCNPCISGDLKFSNL